MRRYMFLLYMQVCGHQPSGIGDVPTLCQCWDTWQYIIGSHMGAGDTVVCSTVKHTYWRLQPGGGFHDYQITSCTACETGQKAQVTFR